jgi:hypothetical protein
MEFIIMNFPDRHAVIQALTLVENHRDSIVQDSGFVAVGRYATLRSDSLECLRQNRTIHCKTFISLGKIEIDTLKVFADHIILANEIHVPGYLEFNAITTCVSFANITGEGDLKIKSARRVLLSGVILNCHTSYEDETCTLEVNGVAIHSWTKRVILEEWKEDPIDATIRMINEEIAQEEMDDVD